VPEIGYAIEIGTEAGRIKGRIFIRRPKNFREAPSLQRFETRRFFPPMNCIPEASPPSWKHRKGDQRIIILPAGAKAYVRVNSVQPRASMGVPPREKT
jgi:hypothetical protein